MRSLLEIRQVSISVASKNARPRESLISFGKTGAGIAIEVALGVVARECGKATGSQV